jgi:hypothetical protein
MMRLAAFVLAPSLAGAGNEQSREATREDRPATFLIQN